jgi:tripartite-type tricarboxylate transporter receptor subunit TctC
MEFVAQQEGIKWTYVTFSGGPEAMSNVLGGHVNAMSDSAEWLPHVKSGDLRLLATHGEKRMKDFPDVPTFRELGYNYVNPVVFLLAVPKNTPPGIVKTLDDALHQAADDPEFVKTLEKMDMTVIYRNSEDAKKYLQTAYGMIGKMIKDFNLPTELKKPEQK